MTGILTNVYIDVWLKKYKAAIKAITRTLSSSEAVPRPSSCCLQTLPILTHSNEAFSIITTNNKATGDSRLCCPRVCNLVAPPGESQWIIHYIADSKPVPVFGPLCSNMRSSTKPEVHNVLHFRQRRVNPQPQVACTENYVTSECVVLEICEQLDGQRMLWIVVDGSW